MTDATTNPWPEGLLVEHRYQRGRYGTVQTTHTMRNGRLQVSVMFDGAQRVTHHDAENILPRQDTRGAA
jgi:hypothetical protein